MVVPTLVGRSAGPHLSISHAGEHPQPLLVLRDHRGDFVRRATIGDVGDLITKLLPILHVQNPDAERRFYELLGLRTTYEGRALT